VVMPDIFTSPKAKDLTLTETPEDTPAVIPSKGILKTLPKPSSLNLLSMFRMNPLGVKFVNQEDDEQIILFIRRHVATNVPWVLLTLLFAIMPLITMFLFRITDLHLFDLPTQLFIILLSFYYLVLLGYAFMQFIVWFYHVGIVTQKRLLDLDVYNILNHHLAETEIADIVDVSYSQRGFFQSFFNYGNVPIQTEAMKANFEFEEAPRPAVISDVITDLRPPETRR
jgi:hypothetical protein